MSQFTYPTTQEIKEISAELQPKLIADSPIFTHFPIIEVNSSKMSWEQRDSYRGMQQVRGLNGQPGVVSHVGAKRYSYEPGVYGEVYPIDEMEITERARLAQVSPTPISIDDLVMGANRQLLHRENVLIEYILWLLVTTGTFAIAKDGYALHTDAYAIQTATAAVDWDTVATATPITDFRAVKLLGRGKGVSFGGGATAYMNLVTFNKMLANTNTSDLRGQLALLLQVPGAGPVVMDLSMINKILVGADLPQIAIYDEGYLNDAGTWVPFIANDKVAIVGKRVAGEPLGEYRKTINANNDPVGPGSYVKVVDSAMPGNANPVPRKVDIHRGHNGGPVIYYPSGVVVLSV